MTTRAYLEKGRPVAPVEREPHDRRVPIMMSAAELKAVDDWMFANRLRSRSEAIRQLCAKAIQQEEPTS